MNVLVVLINSLSHKSHLSLATLFTNPLPVQRSTPQPLDPEGLPRRLAGSHVWNVRTAKRVLFFGWSILILRTKTPLERSESDSEGLYSFFRYIDTHIRLKTLIRPSSAPFQSLSLVAIFHSVLEWLSVCLKPHIR